MASAERLSRSNRSRDRRRIFTGNIYTSDEYLKTKRIELDSIAAKVGAAGLWKYILHRLQSPEIAPQGFDLNQAVTIPANEVFYPKAVSDLLTYLNNYTDRILSEEREVIELELEGIRELTEIKSEEKDIEERLRNVIAEDEGMRTIALEFDILLKRLPKINDEDEE